MQLPSEQVDWTTFGADRPAGWVARFDGCSLSVSGESAFGLATTAETPDATVVFDGLLHNRDELQRRLFGHDERPPRTHAEVVARAYLRWGQAVFEHLHGVFAAVVCDHERREVLAARDPLGVFPLFYAQTTYGWYFSTNLGAMLDRPGIAATINRAHLVTWLTFVWAVHDETTYQEIRRVPTSYRLTVDADDHATLARYWRPMDEDGTIDWLSEKDMASFGPLVEQALNGYLRLGRAGIYLSGGLDSVSVAAYAEALVRVNGRQTPLALSVQFPNTETDESKIQRDVARQLGLELVIIPFYDLIGSRNIVREALRFTAAFAVIHPTEWLPAYVRLGALGQKRGCRLILTGAGGDEWLGVTPYYGADLVRRGDVAGLVRLISAFAHSYRLRPRAIARDTLWEFSIEPLARDWAAHVTGGVAPDWLRDRRRRHWQGKWPDWLAPDPALRRELDQRVELILDTQNRYRRIKSVYARQLLESIEHGAVSAEYEAVFEEGRRSGMPKFSPFLDSKVVSFLLRTPPELLNQGGRSKGLIRETVAHRFPHLGFDRQRKLIGGTLFKDVIHPQAREILTEMGGALALERAGIIDHRRLAAALGTGDTAGDALPGWQVLYLLHVENWLGTHEQRASILA